MRHTAGGQATTRPSRKWLRSPPRPSECHTRSDRAHGTPGKGLHREQSLWLTDNSLLQFFQRRCGHQHRQPPGLPATRGKRRPTWDPVPQHSEQGLGLRTREPQSPGGLGWLLRTDSTALPSARCLKPTAPKGEKFLGSRPALWAAPPGRGQPWAVQRGSRGLPPSCTSSPASCPLVLCVWMLLTESSSPQSKHRRPHHGQPGAQCRVLGPERPVDTLCGCLPESGDHATLGRAPRNRWGNTLESIWQRRQSREAELGEDRCACQLQSQHLCKATPHPCSVTGLCQPSRARLGSHTHLLLRTQQTLITHPAMKK